MTNLSSYLLAAQSITLKRQSEVCANNIANGQTEGFRGDHISVTAFKAKVNNGETVSYAVEGPGSMHTAQGSLKKTEDPYTVALVGPGFFTMEGGAYARNGILLQNADGELVNGEGVHFLSADGEPITVPPGATFFISRAGVVSTPEGPIGQLGTVSFADEKQIQKQGNNLYVTDQPPQPLESPNIVQGFLEQSNVQMMKELVDLTNYTFAYQEDMNMMDQSYGLRNELVSKLLRV